MASEWPAIAALALAGGLGGCAATMHAPAFGDLGRRGRVLASLLLADVTRRSPPRRRVWAVGAAAGAAAGFSVLGFGGAAIGSLAGPFALGYALNRRRARLAARIDACAADFAVALASALVGGRSVRGAVQAAARATPPPLAEELDRMCVDLALGQTLAQALVGLRRRTGSTRIEAVCGAIELHGGSGGDLVTLARELAAAFRERDTARRDARAATAQARFTALIVAAIPLLAGLVAELSSAGSVSGAFAFAPSAVLMSAAIALLATGCLLCARIGRVE